MTTHSQATGLRISSVIFGIVSIIHLVRLFTGPEVWVGTHRLGAEASLIVVIVTGCLSIWLAKLAGPRATKVAGPSDI